MMSCRRTVPSLMLATVPATAPLQCPNNLRSSSTSGCADARRDGGRSAVAYQFVPPLRQSLTPKRRRWPQNSVRPVVATSAVPRHTVVPVAVARYAGPNSSQRTELCTPSAPTTRSASAHAAGRSRTAKERPRTNAGSGKDSRSRPTSADRSINMEPDPGREGVIGTARRVRRRSSVSGVARAAIPGPSPNDSSPFTVARCNTTAVPEVCSSGLCSRTCTVHPAWCRLTAVASPATPAPTTIAWVIPRPYYGRLQSETPGTAGELAVRPRE